MICKSAIIEELDKNQWCLDSLLRKINKSLFFLRELSQILFKSSIMTNLEKLIINFEHFVFIFKSLKKF